MSDSTEVLAAELNKRGLYTEWAAEDITEILTAAGYFLVPIAEWDALRKLLAEAVSQLEEFESEYGLNERGWLDRLRAALSPQENNHAW